MDGASRFERAATATAAMAPNAAKILTTMDWAGLIITGACLAYSVALGMFRHCVFEDLGFFDTVQDVLSFFLLFLIAIRTQSMIEFDQMIVYVCTAGVALFFAWNTYCKYVAGIHPPIRDLTGKVYIVTGANSGIGYDTALQLAHMNATVVLACRTPAKAEEARQEILQETHVPESHIILLKINLCDFDSVCSFVRDFRALNLPLHGLVNNAGVMADHRIPTVDGMEVTFHSNHLSHFLLTNLLTPDLESSRGRVVTVTSSVHNAAPTIQFNDLHFSRPGSYSLFPVYGQSKLANILFAKVFALRHPNICSVAVHPGVVRTHITQNMHWILNFLYEQFEPVLGLFMKSRRQGAYSTMLALLSEEASPDSLPTDKVVKSGCMYYHGVPFRHMSAASKDMDLAEKLWVVSENLTELNRRIAEVNTVSTATASIITSKAPTAVAMAAAVAVDIPAVVDEPIEDEFLNLSLRSTVKPKAKPRTSTGVRPKSPAANRSKSPAASRSKSPKAVRTTKATPAKASATPRSRAKSPARVKTPKA